MLNLSIPDVKFTDSKNRRAMTAPTKKMLLFSLIGIGLLLIIAAGAFADIEMLKSALTIITQVSRTASTPVFIGLAIILPLCGIPFAMFIFMAGIKFGAIGGLAVIAVIMPLHLLIAFELVKFIRPLIASVLARYHYQIPPVPANQQVSFSFLLAVLPVAPYVIKIYLPPLAGIVFRPYFWINWICQYGLIVPLILLGGSLGAMDVRLLGIGLAVMGLGYLIIRRLEKRYGNAVETIKQQEEG
jgi:uncharacterized membrane protein YdjX (TVP38/TMEM64 family)